MDKNAPNTNMNMSSTKAETSIFYGENARKTMSKKQLEKFPE